MKPLQPALPMTSLAVGATAAQRRSVGRVLYLHPAYAWSGDVVSAPSNLIETIGDGGIILDWSSPIQDAASVTGYEILRRRPKEREGALFVLVAGGKAFGDWSLQADDGREFTEHDIVLYHAPRSRAGKDRSDPAILLEV